MDNRPIGVFDSGIGGLTVLREINKILPKESVIYYGDTARVPYGPRTREEIMKLTLDSVKFLMSKDIKALVIACNTVTAVAFDYLKETLPVPIIGVIDPGVKAVLSSGDIKRLGLIATKTTVDSKAYEKRLNKSKIEVISKACPMLVSIVEEGWADTELSRLSIERYLEEFKSKDLDGLIMACTHFPVLRDQIRDFIGNDIKLIDPAEETAKSLKDMLEREDILRLDDRARIVEFYVTDKAEKFKKLASDLLEIDDINVLTIA